MKKTASERAFQYGKQDKYESLIYYTKRKKCSKFCEEHRRRVDQVERATARRRMESNQTARVKTIMRIKSVQNSPGASILDRETKSIKTQQ